MKRKSSDRLARYRDKREARRTTEPFGGSVVAGTRIFVVQQHAARRLHYDLRLELDGVLLSWAVPRGPSFDPEEKRLAVAVEEHPLDYADFEGIIPEGNYGAGAVIVWDRGQWVAVEDVREGLKKGKLLFDLWGHKLRGRWTLFKTKGGEPNHWLLMKKPDAYADPETEPEPGSIFSGLTVDELRDGVDREAAVEKRLSGRRTSRWKENPPYAPMLAKAVDEPFSRDGWVFELKYDGYRLLASKAGQEVELYYRRGGTATSAFPEIARAMRALPLRDAVIDGELVVLDPEGRPSFQRLQQRVRTRRALDIQSKSLQTPATLFTFDLLSVLGRDVRSLPLVERKSLLREFLPAVGPLRYSEHFEREGRALYDKVVSLGLEGIVGKRQDAGYRGGRSADWVKIRADRTDDFVVVGFTRPKRGRSGFGALHLARWDGEAFRYAGRVGTGFSDQLLEELRELLDDARVDEPPCAGDLPEGSDHNWVRPERVVEVRYKEWTGAGNLRHPVFLRLRDDKSPRECSGPEPPEARLDPATDVAQAPAKTLSLTNLDKVFWPEEGYTKGDLLTFYEQIAPWLLPYLRERPVVLTRFPDGIDGKSFYQKDAPPYVPDWLRIETMWSEHAEREIHYFVLEDLESLLYVINMGTIPLHLWSSRVSSLQSPDWCILDLDPKGAPFDHVIRLARATHGLCRDLGLPAYAKTSGSTGLHVLVPLGGRFTYEQSRLLAELIARVVAAENPEIATTARALERREGRVYLDFLQNGHGKLLVAPFSVRPLPGAPVSMPLRWSEVRRGLEIRRFHIRSVPQRLKKRNSDPLRPVLEDEPDLEVALSRLAQRLDDAT